MPLPVDLASVAWLAFQGVDEFALHRAVDRRRDARLEEDRAKVIIDQQRYIRELEAMVRPSLVQPIGEQEAML